MYDVCTLSVGTYHYTPIRMAAIQKSTSNKCWRGCGRVLILDVVVKCVMTLLGEKTSAPSGKFVLFPDQILSDVPTYM